MSDTLATLLDLLTLESIGTDRYLGQAQDLGFPKLFGGHVLGQSLVAATNSCQGLQAHSLHAYFIRAGSSTAPIEYQVDRLRDGKSFSVRRVTALQNNQAILILSASFQAPESGFEHQIEMPDVVPPESLPSELDLARAVKDRIPASIREQFTCDRPIEIRQVDPINPFKPEKMPATRYAWFRTTGPMSKDPTLNKCLLAYASDFGLLATSMRPHGVTFYQPDMMTASLDHAMWFYRDFCMDEWLLYASDSPTAAQGRGFNRGNIFRRNGELVACVAQEGLFRQLAMGKETRTSQG
jgi:acyl-CoA thioesterase-2